MRYFGMGILLFAFSLPTCGGNGSDDAPPKTLEEQKILDERLRDERAKKDYNDKREDLDKANNADKPFRE